MGKLDSSPAVLYYVNSLVAEPAIECGPWHSALKPFIMSQEDTFPYWRDCPSAQWVPNDTTPLFPLRDASLPTSTLKFCDACRCHQTPSEKVLICPHGSHLDSFSQNILKSSLNLTHRPWPSTCHTHCLLCFRPWEIVPLHTYWRRNHNSTAS